MRINKITRRDFLKLTGATSAGLALSACGVKAAELAQPTLTAIPSMTPSQVPSPTVTNTPEPTITSTPEPTITSTPKPLTLADFARKIGTDVGVSINAGWIANRDLQKLLLNFSMLYVDSGTAPYGKDWNQAKGFPTTIPVSVFAKDNNMQLHLDHLFYPYFHFQNDSPVHYLVNAPNAVIETWMRERVTKFFEVPYFTGVSFVNEAFEVNDETQEFSWKKGQNPFYKVYGEDYVYEAYKMAWKEATRTGRKVGTDFHLVYNTNRIEWMTPKVEFEMKFLAKLKIRLEQELGISKPFDIGMQFHIRTVPRNQVVCGGVHIKDLEKSKLTQHMRALGEIGNIRITEFSIAGTDDVIEQKDILHTVVESALESKVCKSFLMWWPQGVWDEPENISCFARNVFDSSFKPLFMFDELYKIFQYYATT